MMNDDGAQTGVTPHRGTLILILGILGIVPPSSGCLVFGLIAWLMGRGDLAQMENGTMDRSGESLTRIGVVLGIIGTVLFCIGLLFFILYGVGALALGGAAAMQ